jgi:hypothetical protein
VNDDQRLRLAALEEKLVDLVLDEADPDHWSGEGKSLSQLSQLERGDRYWCKKNAAASLSLLVKVSAVLEVKPGVGPSGRTDAEEGVDRAIARAEAAAAKALERIGARAGPRGSNH